MTSNDSRTTAPVAVTVEDLPPGLPDLVRIGVELGKQWPELQHADRAAIRVHVRAVAAILARGDAA